MKTQNPILQSTIHLICSRLALPALGLALIASSSNLGATDFFSFRDGSWFGPHNDLSPSPWVPSGVPGNGDNVTISHNIQFDSSSAVVTVSNLDIDGGTLSVSVSGPATLGMAGTNSYWNGGCLRGPLLQVGSLTLGGTNIVGDSGYLSNQGTVYQATNATLNLAFSSTFVNQAGGTYDLEGDGGMVNDSAYWYWTSFNNYGLLRKSSGTGVSTIGVLYYNYGGTIQVDSGTLSLAFGGSSSNGTFNVASGAVLDLTGGSSPTWAGQVNGSGAGTVSLNSGSVNSSPSLTLNLPDGLFQWTGGNFSGTTINSNVVTIAGSNSVTVNDSSIFYNYGLLRHTNTATLNLAFSSTFVNQAGGTYDLEGDGGMVNGSAYWYWTSFNNYGLLRKSSGTGVSTIGVLYYNYGGTIQVDSGTLSLAFGGSSSNGTFNVASGAVLDLTGGSSPTWAGEVSGSGTGAVSLSSGTINSSPSLTLNLLGGLFQWTGGNFSGTTINSNVVTIAGSNSVTVGDGSIFYNDGFVHHTNAATLLIGYGAAFANQAGGTYNLEGDGGFSNFNMYRGAAFNNSGLLRKSGGNGTSVFNFVTFNNQNGTIEVDSGTLSLAFGGSSSNGTFNVASGAVLDLTGGSSPTWAGQIIGSGAGTVSLNSGTISSSPSLTLNLPGGLFQWTGGNFSGTTINSNMVTIAGSNSVAVGDWSIFYNYGLLRHTNTATLNLAFSSTFVNQAGGTYDLEGDGGMVNGSAYWYWTSFNNYGLLRKSSGTGVSTIGVLYYNYDGSIEVDSGQLSLNGHSYAQGSGSFIVTLGGTNAGQSGQLLCGPATLGGPLQVKLASGYLPALGDQFQILSCSSLAGAFSSTNMPAGISVSYSNNGVYLVVTGTVPAQILNPAVSNGNFTFSLGTVNSQSYTVQHNDDLATTNWVFDTNFTGNGSLMQCFVPVTNVPQRFFRVSQP